MNRYIKLEDAEKLLTNALRIAQGFDEPLERSLVDLPTIEVSEEQLSKLQASEKSVENTTASEDFTSISRANSKLEVSEDAISREYLKSFEYINKGDFNSVETIREWIDNAPSVVPSRAEGEWVRNFDGNEWYWYCTNCKTQWYEEDLWMGGNEFPNYCPNCGAKMKGADDDRI